MEQFHLSWLVPIFYEKNIHFFNKQPICKECNVKNGVKIKQLAKQPPTLKTLMQKVLVGLWVKNFTFSILSSLKLNFFQPFLARDNSIVCNSI